MPATCRDKKFKLDPSLSQWDAGPLQNLGSFSLSSSRCKACPRSRYKSVQGIIFLRNAPPRNRETLQTTAEKCGVSISVAVSLPRWLQSVGVNVLIQASRNARLKEEMYLL